MRSGASLLGLVLVLGVGYFYYRSALEPSRSEKVPLVQQADIAGVKSDLLSIAQAERLYLIDHNAYGSIEELQRDNVLTLSGTNRRGYIYSAEVDGASHFKIMARPADSGKTGWPAFFIDENMAVTQQ